MTDAAFSRLVRRLACAVALASAGCASASAPTAQNESAARISAGLSRLGASPDRSGCFAEKIASALDDSDASEAVRIVEIGEIERRHAQRRA